MLAQGGSLLNLFNPCCLHSPIVMRREVTLYFLSTLYLQPREIFIWPSGRREYAVFKEQRATRLSAMRAPTAWLGLDASVNFDHDHGEWGQLGALAPPVERCLQEAEALLGMQRLTLFMRDWRHTPPDVEWLYRALEEPYDDVLRGLVAGAPDATLSPQLHVSPAKQWDWGAHGPVASQYISVSPSFNSPLFFGWAMAERRGATRFTLMRSKPGAIPNLKVLDLSTRARAEGLHDLHGGAMWTARAHKEYLLTALDPKAPFAIPREACECLDVDFEELAQAQRDADDSVGAVAWLAHTPPALLARLRSDEWATR